MNRDKLLEKKKEELKAINKIITETLIISQIKYSDYLEAQNKLKEEINQLEENKTKPIIKKTWLDLEGGWKQRVNNE